MNKEEKWIAHKAPHGYELLEDHLNLAAHLAEKYGNVFQNGTICRQATLLHDIGKRTKKFQKVLDGKAVKIDHAIVGAELLHNDGRSYISDPFIKMLLCAVISGHHSEIYGKLEGFDLNSPYKHPDFETGKMMITNDKGKENSLSSLEEYKNILEFVKEHNLLQSISEEDISFTQNMNNEEKMLYARMIYSCLVDADYTSTAAFQNQVKKELIDAEIPKFDAEDLLEKLETYRTNIIKKSDSNKAMNELRNMVYENAKEAGTKKSGFFTMTAPTGTAKTLAVMKFALEQAKVHKKERIFIVLPYLSIISQNASVYREIFGDIVLEDDSDTEHTEKTKELADRWVAPIIVTTSVKFFESLFSNQAVTARKLHNICNSVVVFDECQTLPQNLISVTLNTLQALTDYFKTTVLLSTATQPSYHYRQELTDKFHPVEVIKNIESMYKNYGYIKNTDINIIPDTVDNQKIIDVFSECDQVLLVFNTTKKALKMYNDIKDYKPEDSVFYLSSNLCNSHKKDVIEAVKQRLEQGEPCTLVSTQCIEAGVDVDFPNGAREFAPLSSIVQTAGRVNRNGKGNGKFFVFKHKDSKKHDYPDTQYMNESTISVRLAKKYNGLDLNSLDLMDKYYKKIYSGDADSGYDKSEVQTAKEQMDMSKMRKSYKLIEDKGQYTVIVPYKSAMDKFNELQKRLEESDYCIKKSDMKFCSQFSVRKYDTVANRIFIQSHCHQLYIRTKYPGENERINWYIADIDPIYDEQTGLLSEEKESFVFL